MTEMNTNENETINGVPEALVERVAREREPVVFDPVWVTDRNDDLPEYGPAYVRYHQDRVRREVRQWLELVYPEIRRFVLEETRDVDEEKRVSRADFLAVVAQARDVNPSYRLGQAVFNVAASLEYTAPVAERLRGDSRLDPFYRDANVPAFLDELFGAES